MVRQRSPLKNLPWPSWKHLRYLANAILILYALASLWSTSVQLGQEDQGFPAITPERISKAQAETWAPLRLSDGSESAKVKDRNGTREEIQESRSSLQWQLNPQIVTPEQAKLSSRLLDRFIVIPEYRLLFCYIEKVGCQTFNILLRNLRLAKLGNSMKQRPIWWQNTPKVHGLHRAELEHILMDKTWHKAVFFRDPLERFLSAYRSKCDPQFHPDGFEHCRMHFGNAGKTFKGAVKWTVLNHEEEYAAEFDEHFRPMHQFCGGLYQTLHFYDTVEQLEPQTSREKVEELMKRIGADPQGIPGFDNLFPPLQKFSSSRVNGDHQHNTFSQSVVEDFYGPLGGDLVKELMEVYKTDYQLFKLKPSSWVDPILQGQWVPRPTTTRIVENSRSSNSRSWSLPDQWVKLGTGCCETREAGKLWSSNVSELDLCFAVCKRFSSCRVVEFSKDAQWCAVWDELQQCQKLLQTTQCPKKGIEAYAGKSNLQTPEVEEGQMEESPSSAGDRDVDWSPPLERVWTNEQCDKLGFSRVGLAACKALCSLRASCNAINVHDRIGCVLRRCPHPAPMPKSVIAPYKGYYMLHSETRAPPAKTQTDCFQKGIQWVPPIKQKKQKEFSAESCQKRCLAVSECSHFTFYSNGMCELAPGSAGPIPSHVFDSFSNLNGSEAISGPPRCQTSQEQAASTPVPDSGRNVDWSPPLERVWTNGQCDKLGYSRDSLAACKALCSRRPSCNAIIVSDQIGCALLGCPYPVPTPEGVIASYKKGYYMLHSETRAPPAKTQTDCFQKGIQWVPSIKQKKKKKKKELSAESCQKRCSAVSECSHFTFYSNGTCALARGSANPIPSRRFDFSNLNASEAISGPPQCQTSQEQAAATPVPDSGSSQPETEVPPPKTDCFQENIQYWPSIQNQKKTTESSPRSCQQRCFSVAECVHFTFYPTGSCELAAGDASKIKRRQKHVISGPRLRGMSQEKAPAAPVPDPLRTSPKESQSPS